MKFSNDYIPTVKATLKQAFIGVWFHDDNLPLDEEERIKFYFNRTFYYYRFIADIGEFSEYIDRDRLAGRIFLIISDFTLYVPLLKLTQKHADLFLKIYVFLPMEDDIATPNTCFATSCRRRLFEELSKDILEYTVKENPSNLIARRNPFEIHSINASQVDRTPPSISVFNSKYEQNTPIRHVTKESLKFLCFLTMIDILLRTEHDSADISEMWIACRNLYQEYNADLDHIDTLAKDYKRSQAVQCYTDNSCLSSVVNQACHSEDMQWMFTFRIYMCDLHWELDTLNSERLKKSPNTEGYVVFRGKPLSRSVVQQLIDNEGGFILLNGFLSTTFNPKVAFVYAGGKIADTEKIPVLFQLNANHKIKQPFADISSRSTKIDEAEFLFSLGTVWRIESIELDKNPCRITLTSSDELNSKVTEIFKRYTEDGCTPRSLGDILCELGEDDEAEWFYRKMLEKESLDERARGILYYKIGMIRFGKEDYYVALDTLDRCANLMKPFDSEVKEVAATPRPLDMYDIGSHLLTIYNNIGLMRQKNDKTDAAIECYIKALGGIGSDFERATVHNNLGIVYSSRGNYSEAFEHHFKAVELTDERHRYCWEFRKNFLRAEKRFQHWTNNQDRNQVTTVDELAVIEHSVAGQIVTDYSSQNASLTDETLHGQNVAWSWFSYCNIF